MSAIGDIGSNMYSWGHSEKCMGSGVDSLSWNLRGNTHYAGDHIYDITHGLWC